jgi:RimJ/RimL family protein N-acetyltransferase
MSDHNPLTSFTPAPTIHTLRLDLRPWRDEDLPAFAALNADPRVMEFLPRPLDRAESDARAARIRDHFERRGFGLWAVEVPRVIEFIGFVGLSVPDFEASFTPCVEVGWRLAHEHWGQGYATEAARAALDFGFRRLALDEIVSFTVPTNRRSRGVMERIGMTRTPADDFDHPALPAGHPLRRHVLYRAIRHREPIAESPQF